MEPNTKPVLGFDLIATPSPGVFAVAHTVVTANLSLPIAPVIYSTTYLEFAQKGWIDSGRTQDYGAYVYNGAANAGPGLLTFYFGPLLSGQQSGTQYGTPFQTIPGEEESYYWPPVMSASPGYRGGIQTTISPSPGVSYVSAVNHVAVYKHNAYTGICGRKIERWFSAIPWGYQGTPPVYTALLSGQIFNDQSFTPNGFSYDFILDKDTIPPCLHSNITIAGFNLGPHPVYGDVIFDTIDIAATNPSDWEDIVVSHSQKPVEGGFLRERVTLLEPTITPVWS